MVQSMTKTLCVQVVPHYTLLTLADVDTYSIPTDQAIPVTMKFLALQWLWSGDGLNLLVRVAFHHAFYQISFLEGCVITLMVVSVGHLETKILEFRNISWLVAWTYHKLYKHLSRDY